MHLLSLDENITEDYLHFIESKKKGKETKAKMDVNDEQSHICADIYDIPKNAILFERDLFSSSFVLPVVKLKNNGRYEYVREDLRQIALSMLSKEGLYDARSEFDSIDSNHNGFIDLKEAEFLFAKKSEDAMNRAYRSFPDDIEKLEVAVAQARQLKLFYEEFMKSHSRCGTNGEIVLDDFLAVHAFFKFKDKLTASPTTINEIAE